jgi:hypothetical protein
MTTWESYIHKLTEFKTEFNRLYKCLNKRVLPSETIVQDHLDKIITEYNKLTELYKSSLKECTTEHSQEIYLTVGSIRDRLGNLFIKLQVNINISLNLTIPIDPDQTNPNFEDTSDKEDSNFDNDSNSDKEFKNNIVTMSDPLTQTQFITTYLKVIPEFDGTPENLLRFVDACEFVNDNKEGFENVAVRLIKTKLSGSARSFITTETTITEIINKLKTSIKPETTKVVTAKLMSLKQGNKSAADYVKSIEEMTASLKRAYISEGVSADLAESYTTDTVVKSITSNTTNEKLRTILQAGDFKNINEVNTKFLTISTDTANKAQILNFRGYRNRNNYSRNTYRGNRGNFNNRRGNYQGYGYGNNNSYYNNNNRNNSNYRGQSRNNYRGRNYNNNRHANVRLVDSGNFQVPLQANQGGYSNEQQG